MGFIFIRLIFISNRQLLGYFLLKIREPASLFREDSFLVYSSQVFFIF
jgi:hypothetical protein